MYAPKISQPGRCGHKSVFRPADWHNVMSSRRLTTSRNRDATVDTMPVHTSGETGKAMKDNLPPRFMSARD